MRVSLLFPWKMHTGWLAGLPGRTHSSGQSRYSPPRDRILYSPCLVLRVWLGSVYCLLHPLSGCDYRALLQHRPAPFFFFLLLLSLFRRLFREFFSVPNWSLPWPWSRYHLRQLYKWRQPRAGL